jgi:hypothetical protein
MICTHLCGAIPTNEHDAAAALEPFRTLVGHKRPLKWPVNDPTLVHILADGMGYMFDLAACNEPELRDWVPAVYRDRTGKRFWSARFCAGVANHLELRRRWDPSSHLHRGKMTQLEIADDTARLCGQDGALHDVDKITYEDLLIGLLANADPSIRVGILVALKQKLGDRYYGT